jgi:hypothetical protein
MFLVRTLKGRLFPLLAVSCLFPALQAQVAGTISGYVKDMSAAVVPNAVVTAVSSEQQLTRSALSDNTGFYNLLAMPSGVYDVSITAPGFEKLVQNKVRLTLGENLRLDGTLKVGSVSSEVTVSSSATLVNTSSQTLSGLVDDRRVQDLPLNGRNVMSLANILPGIVAVSAPQEMNNTRAGPNMSVNGGRSISNNFTFNGANFTHFGQTTGMNFPPPDAVQEIRIQTHNFTSEYGNNSGSQVTVTSKSGSNQFHGSAWEFLRNDKLNARSFFQPRRTVSRQNQAGVSAGGPLRKDRLFAFGYYQKLWNRPEAGTTQAFVPTPEERIGDFTGLSATLRNPTDGLTNQPFLDPSGRPCIAANRVSPGCISPAAKTILEKFIPVSPNGIYFSVGPSPSGNYTWMTRVDFLQSRKHNLYGHFHRDAYDQVFTSGNIRPFTTGSRKVDNTNYSLTSTYSFSPTLLNEATFDFMHTTSVDEPDNLYSPSSLGINLPPGDHGEGISVSLTGNFNLGAVNPNGQDYKNWHWRESMSWIRGRHTFKWGYEGHKIHFVLNNKYTQSRSVSFSGVRSGNAVADFLVGAFDQLSVTFGQPGSEPVLWKQFFHFQDEFKVTPRLTLTMGVRWEPYFAWDQNFGRHTFTDIGNFGVRSVVRPDSIPGVLFPGDPGMPGNGKLSYDDLNNWGPRVGFAWDVFGNGKTSVRGGYGIFYDQLSANVVHTSEAPFAGTDILRSGRLDDPYRSLNRPLPPSGILTGNFGCVDIQQRPGVRCDFPLPANLVVTERRLVVPYTQSMSLSIERQILSDVALAVSYAGKLSQKLEGHRHWNPAVFKNDPITGQPPSATNVNNRVLYPETIGLFNTQSRILGNDYRANYHALQIRVDKRFSRGLSLLGSYALSKGIDNVVTPEPGLTPGVANPFNLKMDKGRSDFDRRHVVSISWLWSPQYKFNNPVARRLLENWSVSSFHSIQTGEPISFVMGTDVALDGTGQQGLQHAQLAPGVTLNDIRRDHADRNDFITQFFNAAAFVPVAQLPRGIYGNAGRNTLTGPATNRTDLNLMKDFMLKEQWKLQLRGELFNAFNQVTFNNPVNSASAGNFGRITGSAPGRVIQLAAKVVW